MIRLIQIALLLAIIIPFGMAVPAMAQDEASKALAATKKKWEDCLNFTAVMRIPSDGVADYASLEAAFQDCASEEKLILAMVDAVIGVETVRRQAIALHYKRRVDLKEKMLAELGYLATQTQKKPAGR